MWWITKRVATFFFSNAITLTAYQFVPPNTVSIVTFEQWMKSSIDRLIDKPLSNKKIFSIFIESFIYVRLYHK